MKINETSGGTIKLKHNRRLQDSIKSKSSTRNMNFDRRLNNNERRDTHYTQHDGSPRRLTIDRRLMMNDRRIKGVSAL